MNHSNWKRWEFCALMIRETFCSFFFNLQTKIVVVVVFFEEELSSFFLCSFSFWLFFFKFILFALKFVISKKFSHHQRNLKRKKKWHFSKCDLQSLGRFDQIHSNEHVHAWFHPFKRFDKLSSFQYLLLFGFLFLDSEKCHFPFSNDHFTG